MKMPGICARCGQRRGTALWEIKGEYISMTSSEALEEVFYTFVGWSGGESRAQSYRVPVPVCEVCLGPLRVHRIVKIALQVAGLIGAGLWVGVGVYKAGFDPDGYFEPFLSIAAGLFGCGVGYLAGWGIAFVIAACTGTALGKFDGRHFRFYNEEFHHQFSLINPSWVDQRRSRLWHE